MLQPGDTALLDLELVEPFAENAYHLALRDESVGVDLFYNAENVLALAAAGKNDENFLLLLGVPTVAVENGNW